MKILALGAHPDDIEYGCGGTLLRLKKERSAEVHFYVATMGEAGGDPEVRRAEQEAAADLLGVTDIHWGKFRDTELEMGAELVNSVENVIDDLSPDMIFVNYPEDTHQDHRNLAEATVVAARYSQRVLYYEDFTARNFQPRFFYDIGHVLGDKGELLKLHASQVGRSYPTGLDILESVAAVANFRGFQAKVKYAEGFGALRYLLNEI